MMMTLMVLVKVDVVQSALLMIMMIVLSSIVVVITGFTFRAWGLLFPTLLNQNVPLADADIRERVFLQISLRLQGLMQAA